MKKIQLPEGQVGVSFKESFYPVDVDCCVELPDMVALLLPFPVQEA